MEVVTNFMKGIAEKLVAMIPAGVLDFYAAYKVPILIVLIALCVVLSLEGYKIFKALLYVIAVGGLGFVGFKYVAGFVLAKFGSMLPAAPYGISYEALIPCILALIGVFLVKFAYKFSIMLLGGACGFAIGYLFIANMMISMFPTLTFLNSNSAKAVIGLIFAGILGVGFILLFKHVFILVTALGCMATAGYLTFMVIMPEGTAEHKLIGLALGALVGIYSTIHQYNEDQRATDIRFYT